MSISKMVTYISMLRGINVSGRRVIKMDALRKVYTTIGFTNVQTYIQSGNVIFQFEKVASKDLEIKIKDKIAATFGFDVYVWVKELSAFKKIVNRNPFIKNKPKSILYLHITFFSDKPDQEGYFRIKEQQHQPDEIELMGKEAYLYCPNGYGNSKLSNSFLEKKLRVSATTRNWKTINKLLIIAEKTDKDNRLF